MTLYEAKKAATHALECMMDYDTSAEVARTFDELAELLRQAGPLAGVETPRGLQWSLDVRAALYVPHDG